MKPEVAKAIIDRQAVEIEEHDCADEAGEDAAVGGGGTDAGAAPLQAAAAVAVGELQVGGGTLQVGVGRPRSRSPRRSHRGSSSSSTTQLVPRQPPAGRMVTLPLAVLQQLLSSSEAAAAAAGHSIQLCSQARVAFEEEHLRLTRAVAQLKGFLSAHQR